MICMKCFCLSCYLNLLLQISTHLYPLNKYYIYVYSYYYIFVLFFIILIAKTFLGTFSITRLSPDPVLSRSALAYETHRDIVQLVRGEYVALMLLYVKKGILTRFSVLFHPQLNVSLSLLRGYSRSTLSNR